MAAFAFPFCISILPGLSSPSLSCLKFSFVPCLFPLFQHCFFFSCFRLFSLTSQSISHSNRPSESGLSYSLIMSLKYAVSVQSSFLLKFSFVPVLFLSFMSAKKTCTVKKPFTCSSVGMVWVVGVGNVYITRL